MTTELDIHSIENVLQLFENPLDPESRLMVDMSSIIIDTLSQVYSTSGNIDQLNPTLKKWLDENSNLSTPTIKSVIGDILMKEFETRRVDHKFFAQIRPQGNQVAILSNLIATYLNSNTIMETGSPVENKMEKEVLNWMADLVGYDQESFSGNIETGGTAANITALWVAREWTIRKLKNERNYRSRMPLYFIASDVKHYSIVKACKMLGMNYKETKSKDLKTDPDATEATIKKLLSKNKIVVGILGVAGATETGLVDNIQDLSNLAKKFNIHLHVDAAYGGPFILSNRNKLFNGIQHADSISIDPHKMLYTPFGAGVILFKDKKRHSMIIESMAKHSGYLESSKKRGESFKMNQQRSFGYSRITGSMSASGVITTWSTINLLGKTGISALLNHQIDLTNYAYNRCIISPYISPVFKPETNTLLLKLANIGHLDGDKQMQIYAFVTSTLFNKYGYALSVDDEIFDGKPVLRFVAMHPYSSKANVKELISHIEEIVRNRI